jgi:hypothetical protein
MNWRSILCISLAAGAACSLTAPACAESSTHERLVAIAQEYIGSMARWDPLRATALGIAGFDGQLPTPGEAARAARVAQLEAWQAALERIRKEAGASMGLVDRDDALLVGALLVRELDDFEVRRADRRDYASGAVRLTDALFTQFLTLPVVGSEGAVQADLDRAWDDIVARLAGAAGFIEASQRLATEPGHLYGVVGSGRLDGAPDFLKGALTDAARAQLLHRPDAWRRFERARDAALAAIARTRATIEARVSQWPENYAMGRAAYDAMLRDEQLLPYDAADLLRMAQDELAHGWAEEAWLDLLSADRKLPFGPASGGGMAPSGPPLVDYYRERIDELRRFVTEHDLVTMPAWLGSMQVVETPAYMRPVSPGAWMQAPRLFSKETTGFYFITPPDSLEEAARRLDMNQDFDRDRILSTAAHEAMPGHFFQLSIARRHPDYVRKVGNSDAFAEGWAFYGEEMFVRLGLYGDDLDARLFTARWERVRGARAVVDPKLATGEWTLAQAVEFFEAQSGFTHQASVEAVQQIATSPGYFIAYTVGRLQLESLLGEYLRRTGARGSLHDFHDRLLSYGCVPFAVVGPELLADLERPAADVRAAAGY